MAIQFGLIRINGCTINVLKSYEKFIYDATCDEIYRYAKKLNLSCLQYIDGAESCIFNYTQSKSILEHEVPLLRTQELSIDTQQTLSDIESVIKDISPYDLLWLESDS